MMSFLSDSFSTVRAFWKPRYAAVLVLVLLFFAVASMLDFSSGNSRFSESGDEVYSGRNLSTLFATHRKLLKHSFAMEQPNRMWGEKCTTGDIVVNQGPTAPLPNGIPTYTVEIMNLCVTGCDISGIHLNCGWFSSARLINPKVFKRLRYNDCLVNDGKPLVNGGSLSFEYANTFLYPLSVASVTC